MATQPVTAQEALELAQSFHDLAVAVGDYRFAHWKKLTPSQRTKLEDAQWSLLSGSSDLVTLAVGIVLDSALVSVARVQQATTRARKALKTLGNVKQAIRVAAAAVGLAAAIASKNPGAIASNTTALLATASGEA